MEVLEGVLTAFGIKLKVIVAGAFGAFISLRFFEGLRWWERWTTFIGGVGIAHYWAEGLAYFLQLKFEAGLAVLLGIFGMAVISAFMKMIKETDWPGIVKSILSFRFGGGKDGGGK